MYNQPSKLLNIKKLYWDPLKNIVVTVRKNNVNSAIGTTARLKVFKL